MPLTFDMPLEKLKNYTGTNPKPHDFELFWKRALSELDNIKPYPELKTADFKVLFARCFHLFFTGTAGARIHAKLLIPTNSKKKQQPALLVFHGYSGNSGDWYEKLGYVAAGFVVAAMDCRGQGGLSEDPGGVKGNTLKGHIIRGLSDEPDKLLFRQIFLDTVQLARVVMELDEVNPEKICATGGSQGGGLTLACAALEPRIKRIAATFPFLCDYKRVWQMDLAKDAYAELREYFRIFDPTHEKEEEIFTTLGYIDVQHLAPWIKADVMMTIALSDQICPPSTQFAVYNKISSKKKMLLYPDHGHEHLPGLTDRIFQFFCEIL